MATIVPKPSNVPGGPTNPRRRRGRPRLADRQLTDSIEEPLARRRLYTRLSQRAWRDRQRQKLASQEAIINDIRAAVLRLERLAVQNKVVEKMPRFATEVFRCVALVRGVGAGITSGSGSADVSGSERDSRGGTGTGTGTETSSIASMAPDHLMHPTMDIEANTGRASVDIAVVDAGGRMRSNVNVLGGAVGDRMMQSQDGLGFEKLGQNIADDSSLQSLLSHGHGARPMFSSSLSPSAAAYPAARDHNSTKLSGSVVLQVSILPQTSSCICTLLYPVPSLSCKDSWAKKLNCPTQPSHPSLSSASVPGPMRTITPLWTYSIHETSFSRRLHRSCIEHCYRLLSSHHTRRAELLRTLKFPLAARLTVDELRRRARELLLRGTDQSLHYEAAVDEGDSMSQVIRRIVSSSRRPLTSLLPRPASTSFFSSSTSSSWTSSITTLEEGADAPHAATVSEIHVSGYEGAWLGPDGVALYLHTLGIPIQERPSSMTVPWAVPSNALEDMVRGSTRAPYLPPPMPAMHTHAQFYPPHAVVVNMDLDLMVDTLTQRSVCVDTPMFRKEDVDKIVVDALVSWYRAASGGEEGRDC
ncbi:hypothetical protein CLAIMM_00457 isoform 2 [Cladophialophora immunda]|nr:hypothetical protein CLAIMM_00457 isoform 2 [Cladophialophora immunda]